MVGTITANDEVVLAVTVVSLSESRRACIEVIVDTGEIGHLRLHSETVECFAQPVIGSTEFVLADGSTLIENVCLARVVWHGTQRSVQTLVADAVPLLGMPLLPVVSFASRLNPAAKSSSARCTDFCPSKLDIEPTYLALETSPQCMGCIGRPKASGTCRGNWWHIGTSRA